MESLPEKFVCGSCHEEWLTAAEELAHTCPVLGCTPTDPQSMGESYREIQKAALTRGLDSVTDDEAQRLIQQEAIDKLS